MKEMILKTILFRNNVELNGSLDYKGERMFGGETALQFPLTLEFFIAKRTSHAE